MTNAEKFTALLNDCQNPPAVYDALLVLAPLIRELRKGGGK